MRSAVYLPPDAPSRPGAWHLPQVRAQALGALIDDVAGWARNIHGLLVVLLGTAGAGTLILATSRVAGGWVSWLLVGTASVAFIAWAVWGVWLATSSWRAIAATGRWHAAYVRGTGASGQVVTPSVADVFTPAMIVRLAVALVLLAATVWTGSALLTQDPTRQGHDGGYLALAVVLGVSGFSALASFIGLLIALRRRPSPEAYARARAQTTSRAAPEMPLSAAPQSPAGPVGTPVAVGTVPAETGSPVPAPPPTGAIPSSAYAPPSPHPSAASHPPDHAITDHAIADQPPSAPDPPLAAPPVPAPVAPSSGLPAGEDVEATRLAARLGPIPPDPPAPRTVQVQLMDGRIVPGDAVTLIGRDPSPHAGERVDGLLRMGDEAVSKTHLCMRICGARVSVTDRASTNGTVLCGPDGTEVELEPWQETAVPPGSTLRLGATRITVVAREEA